VLDSMLAAAKTIALPLAASALDRLAAAAQDAAWTLEGFARDLRAESRRTALGGDHPAVTTRRYEVATVIGTGREGLTAAIIAGGGEIRYDRT
jgi:hypothetical protein